MNYVELATVEQYANAVVPKVAEASVANLDGLNRDVEAFRGCVGDAMLELIEDV